MTARDLVRRALVLIGVLAEGESPSGPQANDAFLTLKELIDTWSAEGLLIFHSVRESLSLVPGQMTQTIGSVGADLLTSRPNLIRAASVKISGIEVPIEILQSVEAWARISSKETQSSIPSHLYFNKTLPLGEISFYPIPSEACELILYSEKPLTLPLNLSEDMVFPEGYAKALRFNLAIDLCPEYGKEISAVVDRTAAEAKASIQRRNTEPGLMVSDCDGLTRRTTYNILEG